MVATRPKASIRFATRRADPAYDPGIAARGIIGHLLLTDTTITAWYVLAPQRWSFRTDAECNALITAMASRFAELVGHRLHLRITSKPFATREWARALDDQTPHPLPNPCPEHPTRSQPGCDTCVPGAGWYDLLATQQIHMQRAWPISDKAVFLGVDIADRKLTGRMLGRLWKGALDHEARSTFEKLRKVTEALAGRGLRARPATPAQLEYLMHRSCGLGLPAPRPYPEARAPVPYALAPAEGGIWDDTDLSEFTARAQWHADPFDPTVTVTGAGPAGEPLTRHVAVLSIGRVPEAYPEGWMQLTDNLPFPVEWAATIEVRPPGEVLAEMRSQMARIRSQVSHYTEDHGQEPPAALSRQAAFAREIEDEQTHGMSGVHTRVQGWFRLAVSGTTREEALRRAGQVAQLYEPTVTVVHDAPQYAMAREFIPGEPLATVAHRRRMSVRTLAGGVPAATPLVGDRHGFPLGYTSGRGARAALWHPWYGTEVTEQSGLTPIVGGLGSGKSTLIGLIVYWAVRAGVPATVLDPSGMLDRLCLLPELAPYALGVDLLRAEPGTLCPYRVIADPKWEDCFYDDHGNRRTQAEAEKAFYTAKTHAMAQRRQLCRDILLMLLPPDLVRRESIFAIEEAVAAADASHRSSPWEVIAALKSLSGYGLDQEAQLLGRSLERLSDMPQAALFFPAGHELDSGRDLSTRRLTVLMLRGLNLPRPDVPARERSIEEQLSVPLLHLAAYLTRREIDERPRAERKLLVFDETHALTRDAVGRDLVARTSRDSRKRNTRVLTASQNAGDLLVAGVANLLAAAFVGRTVGQQEQADALKLLGLERGVGYEQLLAGLSPSDPQGQGRTGYREWIFADGNGGIERIFNDIHALPHLRAALDTTADPSQLQQGRDHSTLSRQPRRQLPYPHDRREELQQP
ncbi:ATP-binding protein (plasmid) [Nonomuraea sp. NBC_00507]|uniref:ATP-binding protein n=1 Tax=Nonomuraea sp. NBC_00507 TaxID=2976002 RepID=UPI002E17F94B